MAFLYVWEFSEVVVRDGMKIPKAPGVLQQSPVGISDSSAQSSKFNAATAFVALTADETCSINIGTNPTATTGNFRLSAGDLYTFGVNPGDQVAVIANS